eukprot:Selendium_serpulae@DN6480_c0_g1_i4.p1
MGKRGSPTTPTKSESGSPSRRRTEEKKWAPMDDDDDDEHIPAPLPTKKERLIADNAFRSNNNAEEVRQMMEPMGRVGDDAMNPVDQAFNKPFAVDTALICSLTFEEAQQRAAADSSRWLLVNIQNLKEWLSLDLNRDFWRDTLMMDVLKQNFVFWQRNSTSNEGQTFINTYKIKDLPFLGIVCHYTGAMVKTWTVQQLANRLKNPSEFVGERKLSQPPLLCA